MSSEGDGVRRWQFRLRSLFAVTAVTAVCATLLVAAISQNRAFQVAERQQKRIYQFRHVLLLLRNQQDVFRWLPPSRTYDADGKPACSWRFQLSRFPMPLVWEDFDFTIPWDAPPNRSATASPHHPTFVAEGMTTTNVFAITGPGTAFAGHNQRLDDLPVDLIVVIEIRNSGTAWAAPGDFDIRTMPRTINDARGTGISGVGPAGFCVGFADGEVWLLSNSTPFDELAKFFTKTGAQEHSRDAVLGPCRVE